MLYPKRGASDPYTQRQLLAMGAAVLFVLAAFLAFGGALQGALGIFFTGMALHALQPATRSRAQPPVAEAEDE